MINMIGDRLHPAVGILLGLALVAAGIAADAIMLAAAGGVVVVFMAARLIGSQRHSDETEDEGMS